MAFPGGFKEYIRAKRRKLKQQHQWPTEPAAPLFSGLVLHVNGYTGHLDDGLSILEFRDLIIAHGALYKEIFDSSVTHVIAIQVSVARRMRLRAAQP